LPSQDAFNSDVPVYVWNAWTAHEALDAGQWPLHSPAAHYPEGIDLGFHSHTLMLSLVAYPFSNPILGMNVGLWLCLVLGATFAACLARAWGAAWLPATVVGLLFGFNAYALARLPEHYNLVTLAWVPLYVGAFHRAFGWQLGHWLPAMVRPGWVSACVLLGAFGALGDYYNPLFMVLYSVLVWLVWALALPMVQWRNWRLWAGIGAGVLVLHGLQLALRAWGVPDRDGHWWGADLYQLVAWPEQARWLPGHWDDAWQAPIHNRLGLVESVMYLGVVVWACLVGGLWHWRRLAVPQRVWLLVGIGLLLYMHPSIRMLGKHWLNGPTGWLHFVPGLNHLRCPARAVSVVMVVLPLMGAVALGRSRRAEWIGAAALLVSAVEFWPKPVPVMNYAQPPVAFVQLAQLPTGPLLELPTGLRDGQRMLGWLDNRSLAWQTHHHHPIYGVYLARLPAQAFAAKEQDLVWAALLDAMEPGKSPPDSLTAAAVQAWLCRQRPRYLLQWPSHNTPAWTAWLQQHLAPHLESQTEIEGYRLWALRTESFD
jgi:hypothetical protein